jgi:hypothetical protein
MSLDPMGEGSNPVWGTVFVTRADFGGYAAEQTLVGPPPQRGAPPPRRQSPLGPAGVHNLVAGHQT